jgi:hypothetical protein
MNAPQPSAPFFRLPNVRQRVSIFGRTGSGKTQFGAWMLSYAPFDVQPYVIVDSKGDDLLNATDRIKEISLKELPKFPGLYIVKPSPEDDSALEAWLRSVWKRGRMGVYIDEAYSIPAQSGLTGAYRALLTQGRSKYIPVISLSQRPAWVSRFVFTEADFYAAFHLNDARDRATVNAFLPPDALSERSPPYHSFWYDVGQDFGALLRPVPDADSILDRIETRLAPRRKVL